jgi:transcriptional regulator with XRE-family HTH domain
MLDSRLDNDGPIGTKHENYHFHFKLAFCEIEMQYTPRTYEPHLVGGNMPSAVARIIDDLRDRGGLKGIDVANIAEVSPATVSRWTSGKALPHPKTQLIISDLRYVVDRLSEFYSPGETRLWLYSKHRLLEDRRAIDLIHEGQSDRGLAVIESLDQGTFT